MTTTVPAEMSNLERFAKDELTRAGLFSPESDYGGILGEATMRLIRTFSAEGHSGFSAGLAVSLFSKVARFEPITPLTGADDEWNEVTQGVFQNRRCSRVFKENGVAYDISGKVFREPDGVCFTSKDSRVAVSFPYTPKTEYVDVGK